MTRPTHQDPGLHGPERPVTGSSPSRLRAERGPSHHGFVRLAGSTLAFATAIAVGGATLASAAPPGRGYELVSPPDRLAGAVPGISTDLFAMPGRSSDDGEALIFGANVTMGPNWSAPANPMVFAHRTESGWQVRSAVRSTDGGNSLLLLGAADPKSGWLTRNGREFVFGSTHLGEGAEFPLTLNAVYRSNDASESPEWLSRPNVGDPTTDNAGMADTVTAADDTRTVAFQSSEPLTADAPPAGTQAVYVRRNGELRLASIDPNGDPFTQRMNLANSVAGHTPANAQSISMRNQLAGNGRFLLMVDGGESEIGGRSVYVRDLDAGVTRQLAGPGTGVPTATLLERYWTPHIPVPGQTYSIPGVSLDGQTVPQGTVFAARDGARAFFHPDPDTADDPDDPKVYDADLATGVVTPRPAITGPPMGLSDDGRHMLFLAPPPAATTGISPTGDWTLRYWSAANPDTSTVVGTITTTSPISEGKAIARVYRSTPDGKTWIFTAAGSPDPTSTNVAPDTQQLYRWSVGDAAPACLTCEPTDGVAREAGVNLTVQEGLNSERFILPTTPHQGGWAGADNFNKVRIAQPGHSVSDDGRWLLFDSPDRLVSEDENDVRDVYLWDRDAGSGGQLQLVTSGQGAFPSYALDLDPTGRNAFFTTREGLVGKDEDDSYDVYVARIGGGFPEPPEEGCASEDACRVPNIPVPTPLLSGSNVLTAPSNGARQPVQEGKPTLRVRSVRTSSKRLTVRIDTPGAGQIRVSGASVRTAKRTAKRASTYTVRVSLSTKARRLVSDGRTVKVKLRVQFTPKGSKKATRVSSSVSVKKGR